MRITSRGRAAIALLAVGSLAVALAGCTGDGGNGGDGPGSIADMEPITLTWTEQSSEGSPNGIAATVFRDYITEQTDGKVTFDVYYAGALFAPTETLAQTAAGVADVGSFSTSYNPDDLLIAHALNRGGGSLNDVSYPTGYFQGVLGTLDFAIHNEDLRAELNEHGVELISLTGSLTYNLLCREPVETLEDAQGVRTRVGGPTWGAEVESLGMTQTFVQVTEMYEALQREVVDCVSLQAPHYGDFSLWEVAKHFTPVALSTFPGGIRVINLERWNSFSDDLKQIFRDGVALDFSTNVGETLRLVEQFFTVGATEHGLQYYDASELNEVVKAFQLEVREGIKAEEIVPGLSGADFLGEYEGVMEEWRTTLVDDLGLATNDPDASMSNAAAEVVAQADSYTAAIQAYIEQIMADV